MKNEYYKMWEKQAFIKIKIEQLKNEKDKVIKDSLKCLSYNPEIYIKKIDKDIESWKNLTDEYYNEIIKEQEEEQQKEEKEKQEFQELLSSFSLTEEEFYNMSEENFENFIKINKKEII